MDNFQYKVVTSEDICEAGACVNSAFDVTTNEDVICEVSSGVAIFEDPNCVFASSGLTSFEDPRDLLTDAQFTQSDILASEEGLIPDLSTDDVLKNINSNKNNKIITLDGQL